MATNAITMEPQGLGMSYYTRLFSKEIRYEFVRLLRTKAFSFSVIGFPVMFYLLFGSMNRGGLYARYLMPSYSCMGGLTACLFGVGFSLSMERAQGWLELKQASPMPRAAYLGAKLVGCAAFAMIVVGILLALGRTVGGVVFTAPEALRLTGVVLAGTVPFTAMALLVALLVPANSGPGIINLIWLPMGFASGFFMPLQYMPHWVRVVGPWLPTYHLAQLALGIFGMAQPGNVVRHWEILFGFTLLMLGTAWMIFARMEAKA